ncbi:uncharacterized protein [Antedon mediterranea]|uniref:uncharacterized protein n=1 Tax=Antedon mediterranea TaxID=105859 RepID=UPI003AF7A4AB
MADAIDLLNSTNVRIYYHNNVGGLTDAEFAIDGNELTLANTDYQVDPAIVLEFSQFVFITYVRISAIITHLLSFPVTVRIGSSSNIRENTICDTVFWGANIDIKTAHFGKFLSLQEEDCSFLCSFHLYEIYVYGVTVDMSLRYNGYYLDGTCYKVVNETSDWLTARTKCDAESDASHLVTVNSTTENDFLFNVMSLVGVKSTWLGLRKENSLIEWVDGKNRSFTNFEDVTNEPSAGCAAIDANQSPEWNWESCTDTSFAYVCKRPISNRVIVHKKYISQKHVATDNTIQQYKVLNSAFCSQYCMDDGRCHFFSFSSVTGECRLSASSEALVDDVHADYFVESQPFATCTF